MKQKGKNAVTALVIILLFVISGKYLLEQNVFANQKNADSEKQVIKIAYLPITHALPLFEEKKLIEETYDDVELELVKYSSWPELMDALSTNRVDGASVLMELAVRAREAGIDLKAVALGHHEGNAVVSSTDVEDVSDLKGKKIAIPHKLSTHNLLVEEMLEENGLTKEDVTLVELSPAEMPAALKTGQIAAYCVAEPFGAKAVESGFGKVLYQSEDLWEDSICCALVLQENFIEQNLSLSKQFVSSYQEAGAVLADSEEETETIASEYLNAKPAILKTSLEWISYDNLEITKEAYQSMIDKMVKEELIENPPSYEDMVEGSLL